MQVSATTDAPTATQADTIVVGVFEDEGIAHDHGGVLQALVDSGEAKRAFRKLAVTHAEGRRYIVAGLGARADFDPERARVAASGVVGRAKELGAKTLCWEVPHHVTEAHAGALVEGTLLASYVFREYKSGPDDNGAGLEALVLSSHHDVSGPAAFAATVTGAVNAARDLQNRPANDLTPAALAERAQAL
jgi:leucyl aminopeptidase